MAGSQESSSAEVGEPKGPAKLDEEDLLSNTLGAFNLPSKSDDTIPSLPHAIAAMRGKSAPEILAELNQTPLFMTSLEENDDIEAFKALAYEGTPREVSLNFKERGNECFQARQWGDAKEFYTKGIQVLQVEQQRKGLASSQRGEGSAAAENAGEQEQEEQEQEEQEQEEQRILETSLVNRAACHLALHNYRSCTLDCAAVLRSNPENIKAFYRSAKALLALSKIPEADDACARGLTLDPSNAALKTLAEQIIAKNAEIQAKTEKETARERQKRLEEKVLRAALMARGIRVRKTKQPPEMEDARVRLVPDPGDPTSELVFPTVFLYPLTLQSDFVKEWAETETLGERLALVLGERTPWDGDGEYMYKGVECYMETIAGGLVKVGKNNSLLKVLGGGKVEVVDDMVRVFAVPKGKAEAWIRDFKMKKAAEKGGS